MSREAFASLFSDPIAFVDFEHLGSHLSPHLAADILAGRHTKEEIAAAETMTIERGVAVVPVRGLLLPRANMISRWLGWSTYEGIEAAMTEISADSRVEAVILHADSPGGLVGGIEAAADAVLACSKPVYAYADPLMASAAYWICSQAKEIGAARGSVVGSIGTASMAGVQETPDGGGRRWHELTSSHAKMKRPQYDTDEGKAEIQRRLDEAEAPFHADVAKARGLSVDQMLVKFSTDGAPQNGGAAFSGPVALEKGLIDRVMSRAEFFADIAARHGGNRQRGRRATISATARVARARAAL